MKLQRRLDRLRTALATRQGRDLAWMVVWMNGGSDSADHRPPGIYQRASVIDLVYEGDEPDPAVLDRLRARMTPRALTVQLGPEVIPPPLDPF